jgi:hypothetical protein
MRTTIDERAKEYANILGATLFMDSPEEDIIYRDDLARAYASGAKEERAELTRWHDPKEIVPNHKWAVLVKLTPSIYDVASYSTEMERWIFVNYSLDREEIIGWREIHE